MAHKILVVEDERHIARLVQVNLEHAGYEVITARDGREALEKIDSEHPDLMVLDVIMPYMDGFEVLETVRRTTRTHDLPVILLTTKVEEAAISRGIRIGANSYMTKPFQPAELVRHVRAIFDPSGGSRAA